MLLADIRPNKTLFEFYNRRIFARGDKPQQLQPAGRNDDLEESFEELMRDFTNIQVADDVHEGEADAEISEVAVVSIGTVTTPANDSRGSSAAPSSTTGSSGDGVQPIRGDRVRQAKAPKGAPKGSTRRREDVEDSELDKAPKRQTKTRKK